MTKIALATDDGRTISAHFGRAGYFAVVTVENGQVTGREQRAKPAHEHGQGHEHGQHMHGGTVELHEAGQGPSQEDSFHGRIIEVVKDCQVVVARGMGQPMYERLNSAGMRPVITDVRDIDEAVRQWAAGELTDHTERLH